MMTTSTSWVTSTASSSGDEATVAQATAEVVSIDCELRQIEEQLEEDEQRMFFLLNADTARQDFYEIRSMKGDTVRRIIINDKAEIIFDSENTTATATSDRLVEFDEIDEKFLHVIPDTHDGRSYYRRLRGTHAAISRDLPKAERRQRKQACEEAARQLRQTIVDNFQQLDSRERQVEIDDIIVRKDAREEQRSQLHAQKVILQQQLLVLQQQIEERELERQRKAEADNEARRKQEHDSKRLAWLDRFAPPPRKESASMETSDADDNLPETAESAATTDIDELDGMFSDVLEALSDVEDEVVSRDGVHAF